MNEDIPTWAGQNETSGEIWFRDLKVGAIFRFVNLAWRKLGGEFPAGGTVRPFVVWPASRLLKQGGREGASSPLARFKASVVKFTIQYGPTDRPRNRCFVMGGYSDGQLVFVLYRVMGSGERLGKIVDPPHLITKHQSDPLRLPIADWPKLMERQAGERFSVGGRSWVKLSPKEVAPFVEGKVFRQLVLS